MGEPWYDSDSTHYYTTIDFAELCEQRYGEEMASWLRVFEPIDVVMRLALQDDVILLPGRGFDAPDWSVRVSLANLPDAAYEEIGKAVARQMARYNEQFLAARKPSAEAGRHRQSESTASPTRPP